MSLLALIGSSCESDGHPSECQEPAPGTVEADQQTSVSINGINVYSASTASMVFPDHAHDYDPEDGCISVQSHSIDPDNESSVTINGSPVFTVGDSTTDPGSGGTAEIISTGQSSVDL